MASATSILVVEDHPLFLEALQRAICTAVAGARTVEANSIEMAKDILQSGERFDLVLLDLSLPGTRGFEGLLELRGLFPKLPIVVISAHETRQIIEQIVAYGAAGFIAKSVDKNQLAAAIKDVLDGAVTLPEAYRNQPLAQPVGNCTSFEHRIASLTPKQLAVLAMLRQGLLNKQIAHELQIEETTVKAHVSEILRKLDVASRTQAVIEAQRIDFDSISSPARFTAG